ncbi:hypothetical protein AAMO2058_000932900 [Amorphochlora amoebiformis]
MIGRFQRLNLRDQLDALIKLQVGDTVEGKVLDPGWTTRSKIKKGRNPAMSKPSTILDGPYNNLLQYVSVHKSQGLIVSSRPTSFSKIVALFMEKILAMQEAFQKDLFLMSSTHDGQQKPKLLEVLRTGQLESDEIDCDNPSTHQQRHLMCNNVLVNV